MAATSLLLGSLFTLILLLVEANWPPLWRADLASAVDLHRYAEAQPAFVTAMRALSMIGSALAWTAVLAVAVGWLFWRRRNRLAIFVAVTAITSSLVNELVKRAADRARPVLPDALSTAAGFSLPSGHAQAAVVGFGVLLLVFLPALRRSMQIVLAGAALAMAALIGFSRIALGVHYLSDVVAGYVLGAAWLAAMIAAFDAWPDASRPRPPASGDSGRV